MRGKVSYSLFIMSIPPRKPLPYDLPASYQIIVEGRIDTNWSDLLEGMKSSQVTLDDYPHCTCLEGELIDQAALAGVMNALYEMHLTVISVKRLDE
jgi:hypothetical protein